MNQIASPLQLRLSFARWALLFVPLIVLLGFSVSSFVQSGNDNPWFALLVKPEAQPPGWAFGAAWAVLYVMMGVAFTLVFVARGAQARGVAIALFVVQLLLNLAWPIYFFGMHQVSGGFYLLLAVLTTAFATTIAFGRVRKLAAWLMVPYLMWLSFASILNKQIDTLNPDAEAIGVSGAMQSVPLNPGGQ